MDLSEAEHAFITGGASGIGLGIADALVSRGLKVTIVDIDREALDHAMERRGPMFRALHLDTRDREGWVTAKANAEAAFGPVDILVNNAGIAPNGKGFAQMDPESFDRILAINLTGIYNGIWAFAAEMRDRGKGHIVLTSSQAGLTASVVGVGAYAVAKFGVTALGESLQMEMAPHGIGVSLLFPGYVKTNLGPNTVKIGGEIREYASAMPESKISPGEIGEMVAEAIEQDAHYVITHPGVWPSIEKRMQALRAACELREGVER